jgi:hypothetical protein
MLAIRDLLAWAPGSLANRENRYNASGSYLFLDSSCSPHPVPRKLTLTGLFALHSLAGWASQLPLRTANESYCYHSCTCRPSSACADEHRFTPAARPNLTVARWGTADASWCPRLEYPPVPRLFRNDSSRLRVSVCSDRTDRHRSTVGSVVIAPSHILHRRAVSLPTCVGSGLLSCDHGLSPGLSTNWENIRIVKERG